MATFGAAAGPFARYERRVERVERPDGLVEVTERTEWRLDVRYWGPLLWWPVRRHMRRPRPLRRQPWWAPPERLDPVAARSLSVLAAASVVAGYLSTLIGQTMTFAADELGADEAAQGASLAVVRAGVLIALGVVALADRKGRRAAIVVSAGFGIVASATGALAPDLVTLTATQLVGRAFATALFIVVPIVAAEEMPAGSRAYALSLLAMASSLGAGLCVTALPLADLGETGWRLVYVLPLLALPLVRGIAVHLPESRRYRAHEHDAGPAPSLRRYAGRLALLAATGYLLNTLVAPAAQFRNRFLDEERGFSATSISAFILITSAPGGLGIVLGGQLADRRGRRGVAAFFLATSAVATAAFFLSEGWALWAWALAGTILGAAAIPAFKVYEPEMFPTRLRGAANGVITVVTLLGSVTGLLLAGVLTAPLGGVGPAVAVLAVAPVLAGAIVIWRYPETAHAELEDLNPEDRDTTAPGLIEPAGGVGPLPGPADER